MYKQLETSAPSNNSWLNSKCSKETKQEANGLLLTLMVILRFKTPVSVRQPLTKPLTIFLLGERGITTICKSACQSTDWLSATVTHCHKNAQMCKIFVFALQKLQQYCKQKGAYFHHLSPSKGRAYLSNFHIPFFPLCYHTFY